jgi:hypothetical protein
MATSLLISIVANCVAMADALCYLRYPAHQVFTQSTGALVAMVLSVLAFVTIVIIAIIEIVQYRLIMSAIIAMLLGLAPFFEFCLIVYTISMIKHFRYI